MISGIFVLLEVCVMFRGVHGFQDVCVFRGMNDFQSCVCVTFNVCACFRGVCLSGCVCV